MCGGRYLAFQDIEMVGQGIAFEPKVGQHHDGILHMIILKNRQGGIGRINGKTVLAVSSDCFQRKRPDAIINFLKRLPDYAAFFTSGTITVASRYDFNDKGLPVFM